ncbi:Cu2+-exporting ATPase/Cu+-exporting ATPase [Persephonella hydrogeniphila]|uniref:Cu2+-exporting ATPase/Cu+-exporting ATPase n=2 Tax=Persephonella hydrogeniphila TaxID=198703 RepID=A0A285NNM1_9AQUI|nr:Cu2+-exporting ATPase/Cu+-exporting ATPase [Persephonella hydrogeniphila]
MNLLVVLGTSAAYFYSVFVMILPDIFPEQMRHLYFEGAASIITFVLLGRYLETKSRNKATDFMKKLLNLQSKEAVILVDGKELKIPVENVVVGDKVIVRAGEKIPVDGAIVEGSGAIDQSFVTGESVPVLKKEGDYVIGGTINRDGFIIVKATKTGKDTFLSQMVKLLSEAQDKKPPVGKLADRIVSIFVPAIMIISVIVFDIWYFLDRPDIAFLASVSVLIIACPCALGIATPIAVVSAVGRGAKEGILIKNPDSLEKIRSIDTAFFDKTGTVTEGKLSITEKVIKDNELLKYAYPLVISSKHPVLEAIKWSVPEGEKKANNIKTVAGKGIKGDVNGKEVIIGNREFLMENGINLDIPEGKTEVIISVDKKIVAYFFLEDRVKDEAKYVIQKLKSRGIETVLLTGDRKTVGEKICQEIGFDKCFTQLLPEDKYRIVTEYQKKGRKTVFIGDGINDAPAMAVSDTGIAVMKATDLAKEAGDLIILKDDLRLVLKALSLSKETVKTIKQNLFWAYAYNTVGIPVAAGILFPFFGILLKPIFAGIAMSFSSVTVVLNALRLQFKDIGD